MMKNKFLSLNIGSVFLGLVVLQGASALDVRLGATASNLGSFGGDAIVEGGSDLVANLVTLELGLEAGQSGGATRILVPAGLAWDTDLADGWNWGVAVHGLGGTVLGPTGTTVVWGGEAELRGEFAWVPGLAVGLALGARTVSAAWEFPLHIVLELPLGPEDPLEPWEGHEDDPDADEKNEKE